MAQDRQNSDRPAQDSLAPTGSPTEPGLDEYPELAPLISLAVDAVVYIFDIDEHSDGALVDQLTATVTARTLELYRPMARIAAHAADSARRSREARAAEVARDAQAMAARVADTAAAVQTRSEMQAAAVARDAAGAADLVTASGAKQTQTVYQLTVAASQVLAAVRAAVAEAMRDRAAAAALVAESAAAAAADIAHETELRNIAHELEASAAAVAVRAIALDSCYQGAIEAGATAAEQALGDRASATVSPVLLKAVGRPGP